MMAIKAALDARGEGETRTVVLVPESAHGTNPATAALRRLHGRRRSRRAPTAPSIPRTVKAQLGPDVAAIMLTNPNTCGLFERDIVAIADGGARGRRLSSTATAPTSTPSSARCGRAISASTPCTSTCTRPSRRRMAAAARAPARSCSRSALAPFAPVPFVRRGRRRLRARRARGARPARAALRPHTRLPRPDGHVRARAHLHAVARRRRHAAGLRGRGAQRQLHPRRPRRPDVAALRRPALHARGAVRRRLARRHRRHHARFRQGDDRRGLSTR